MFNNDEEKQFWTDMSEKWSEAQTWVAIEEMAELTQALVKHYRKPDDPETLEHIIEEMADVEIMLHQLKIMYNIDESKINEYKKLKYERTKERAKDW